MARSQHPRSRAAGSPAGVSGPPRRWLAGLGIGALLAFGIFLAYEFTGGESTSASAACSGGTHIFLVDTSDALEDRSAARIQDEVLKAVGAIAPGERIVISRIGDSPQASTRRIANFCKPAAQRELPAELREALAEGLPVRTQAPAHSPIVEAVESAERAFRTSHGAPKESSNLHIYSDMMQNSPWWSMAELAVTDWCDMRKFREARNSEVKALGRPARIYTQRVDIHLIKYTGDVKWHRYEPDLRCFWEEFLRHASVTWSSFIIPPPKEPGAAPR